MKHVTIIIPEGQSNLSSIVGPYKILKRANRYLADKGLQPVFDVQLAGFSKDIDLHDGLFTIHPHIHIKEIGHTDLIIIPAFNTNFSESLKLNQEYIPWIVQNYKQGAEVVSICTGAFLLASTGLLKGRNCSTHWLAEGMFRKMFPDVNLVADKIITDEQGICTNGGAYSFLHLMLYLVEKYCSRETAIFCSKVFEIDIDRNCQSPFTVFAGQKDHQDDEIKKVQHFIENHVGEKISVEDLAARFAIGRRNFDRRFKKATSNTPAEYLQRVKIEGAKKMLETSRKSINEVMNEVGYTDQKAFRTIFKKITGLSPLEYRSKYNKEAAVLI